jgi:uncharacterized membrane protein HdeD (DUF308 family)
MTGTTKAASEEREVHDSASALALGLGLLFGGVAVVLLARAFSVVNWSAVAVVMFFGIAAIVAGVVQTVIGVYQCADNIDRAAKVLIDGQRASQKSDDSTAL